MFRVVLSLVLLASLVLGCSGGSGPAADGGTDVSDAGDAPLDAATCDPRVAGAPTIEVTTPIDGARLVHPDTTIAIVFSEGLDVSTLTPETVRVRSSGLDAFHRPGIRADVSFDPATCTLRIDPTRPMNVAADVRVTLEGLTDLDGEALPTATLRFRTHEHARIRTAFRGAADGAIWSLSTATLDSERRNHVEVSRDAPGDDGAWETEDDPISFAMVTTYDAAGHFEQATYVTTGADLRYGTVDDVVDSYDRRSETPYGHATDEFDGPGTNGEWFDEDDTIHAFQAVTTDPLGVEIASIRWRYPGPDGDFHSDDDVANLRNESTNDAFGFRTTSVDYVAGADGVLVTDDDDHGRCFRYAYDSLGRLVLSLQTTPGADARCDTDDDSVDYESVDYTQAPARVRFGSTGPDRTFGTDDDTLVLVGLRDFDAAGHFRGERRYMVGADGVPFTSDDACWSRVDELYASNGLHAATVTYAPGPDGRRGTDDDVASMRTDFDTGP